MQSSSIVITSKTSKTIINNNENVNEKVTKNKYNKSLNDQSSFEYLCAKLGINHYSTKGKYKHINFMWSAIYQEIQTRKLSFESYSQFINYLCIKHSCTKIENKFKLEYIIRELNNYNTMSEEFVRNSKNYIHRLKIYARKRKCTNMQQLKNELDHYLGRYVVDENEDGKNTYEKQDWLILCRYICDFLENDNELGSKFRLFKKN
jgi:hypothetical protein